MDGLPCATRLHHVGVIVPDPGQVQLLLKLLGLRVGYSQYVPAYEADCTFTAGPGGCVEFIVPRGGKLTQFNKGAGGLHHVALEVDDLGVAAESLRAQGVELLEDQPVRAGDLRINFLPPAQTRGLIVELVECRVSVAGKHV